MTEWRDRMVRYVASYVAGEVKTDTFCGEFEREYNFEATKDDLTEGERAIFEALFNVVVYYTPIAADRDEYRGYTDEPAVRAEAEKFLSQVSAPRDTGAL